MKFWVKIFLVSFMWITFSDCPSNIYTHVQLFATLWTIACQASLFMGFSRQEYWSWLPFPPSGGLPDLRIEPPSPVTPAFTGGVFHHWATREIHTLVQQSPHFLAPGTSFVEDNFPMDWAAGSRGEVGMVWGWFKHFAFIVYLYTINCYYISSTSDHQALDSRG